MFESITEGSVSTLVPYEVFLLRRLQQAQRLAAAGNSGTCGDRAVVPLVRPKTPSKLHRQARLAAAPEGAQI